MPALRPEATLRNSLDQAGGCAERSNEQDTCPPPRTDFSPGWPQIRLPGWHDRPVVSRSARDLEGQGRAADARPPFGRVGLGRDRRRRGPQRGHRGRLSGQGRASRCSCSSARKHFGGACTIERPFGDDRYLVSPCAYVVGLLDDFASICKLELRRYGYQVTPCDPHLWCGFADGTSYADFADGERTAAYLRENGFAESAITGLDAYYALDRPRPGGAAPRPRPAWRRPGRPLPHPCRAGVDARRRGKIRCARLRGL